MALSHPERSSTRIQPPHLGDHTPALAGTAPLGAVAGTGGVGGPGYIGGTGRNGTGGNADAGGQGGAGIGGDGTAQPGAGGIGKGGSHLGTSRPIGALPIRQLKLENAHNRVSPKLASHSIRPPGPLRTERVSSDAPSGRGDQSIWAPTGLRQLRPQFARCRHRIESPGAQNQDSLE
jgi:hypothetical protein